MGHPPGAPFFMLVGNLFTQFTSDPAQVAKMVNAMSALMSAFTILFLFWTITHLTRKLVLSSNKTELTLGQTIIVMGCGIVGALVYTFSDTFWFSAVEAEVYAFSSMLTALVFWLILKWEDNAEKPFREMDYSHRIHYGALHWSPLAQLALYSRYCFGILLQEERECFMERRIGAY